MSAGPPAAKRLLKWKLSPRSVSLLIVLFVFRCHAHRAAAWDGCSSWNFRRYDFFIRHQPKADQRAPLCWWK